MNIRSFQLFLIAVVGLGSIDAIAQAQPAKPTAHTIISKMVERYKTVSTYQDSGVVRLVPVEPAVASQTGHSFRPAAFEADELVSFKTYFARPRMFRFEWSGSLLPGSRDAVIWSSGKKTYKWMPSPGPDAQKFTLFDGGDLKFCLNEAERSSAGAAYIVPSMLLKEASHFSLADYLSIASEVLLLKEQPVDGVLCYVISANLSGVPWTLWVDKKEYVLRKTRTLYSSGSFHESLRKGARDSFYAEEIRRHIKINEPIPAGVFKFKPRLLAGDLDLTR